MTFFTPPSQPQQPGMTPGQYPTGAPYAAQQQYAPLMFDLDGAQHPDDLSRPLYGATFSQAAKRFFRQYVNFSGRASRSEYWWAALMVFLIDLIPGIICGIGIVSTAASTVNNSSIYSSSYSTTRAQDTSINGLLSVGIVLLVLVGLAVFLPMLALSWRRLHDANLPGWVYFVYLVPSIGSIIQLVLMLLPSKPEGRRFDPPAAPQPMYRADY